MNKPEYNKSVWQVCQKQLTDGKDITLKNIMKYSDANRESIFVDYDSNFRNSLNQQPEVFEKIFNHLSKLKEKYKINIIDLNKKRNYGNI